MKDLRIVFMGTPEFAVTSLKKILESDFDVVGVITAPDKPAGRGRKLKASAVKEFALSKNLPVLQPTNLKDDNFVSQLKDLRANIQVVVAFRMLPKVVWQMPEFGTFNLHASLLPQYRGAAPINWAIINGEKETGVTTFFIDEKIDTGQVILQEKTLIEPTETAGSLHDKLMVQGADLIVETLKRIQKGTVIPTTQPVQKDLKTAYKLNKENTKIDWSKSPQVISNLVRGLNPYPVAWSYLINNGEQEQVKIYEVEFEPISHQFSNNKIIIEDNHLKVAIEEGFILIKKIQLPGKKMMESKALLNGYTFYKDAKMV